MNGKCTLLTLAGAAFAASADANPHAGLRADPSTQTWECRAAVSVGGYILPDDGSMPVILTLAGHHGRIAGFIDMEGLPVIGTEFGLRGLSLAWTWEEGSSAVYLNPGTGVATHFHFPNDGNAAGLQGSYHCERTDDTRRELENPTFRTDTNASSRRLTPRDPPLTVGEKEAFGLAVRQCWNVGSLSSSARATTVVVAFDMQRTGVPVVDSIRMVEFRGGSEADAAEAYEEVRRAVIRCGTKGFQLPVEKFDQWREIEATFNAEGLQYK